jgi:hypothetical protein
VESGKGIPGEGIAHAIVLLQMQVYKEEMGPSLESQKKK